MADKRKQSKSESEAADSTNSIFDLFEAPPERDPNSFGKIPVIKDDEIDLTEEGASAEVKAAADVEAAGLQHWTAPPTGQVPAVLHSEKDDQGLWADMKGPSWHGDDPSWSGPDLADVFADTDSVKLGASEDFEDDEDDDEDDGELHHQVALQRPVRSNGNESPAPAVPPAPVPDPRPVGPAPRPAAQDTPRPTPQPRPRPDVAEQPSHRPAQPRPRAVPAPAVAADPRPAQRRAPVADPRQATHPAPAVSADPHQASPPAPETVRLQSNPPIDGTSPLAPTAEGLAVPPAIRRTQQVPPVARDERIPAPSAARLERPSHRVGAVGPAPRQRVEPTIDDIRFADAEEEYYEEEVEVHEDGLDYGPIGGRNLPQAIGVGLALAAIVLAAMFVGPEATLALIVIMALLAVLELYNAMRMAGLRPATLLGIVGTVAAPAAAFYRGDAAFPLIVGLTVVFGTLWYLVGADTERPVLNLSLTMMGIFWVGGLAAFGALMIRADGGIELLLAAIIITVASDTMAYIGGRAYGSRPFHHASPNKTWEGTFTGLIGSVFAGFAIGVTEMGTIWDTNLVPAIVLGGVVGCLAPMGDLAESVVKRDLGVKDMGTLLPGHGGVLDRLDGLLFALPGAYYLALVYGLI